MASRGNQIKVTLTDADAEFLDERRGSASRAGHLRWLLMSSMPSPPPSYVEALELLTRSARNGHAAAQIALARELRRDSQAQPQDDVDAAIQKILDEG